MATFLRARYPRDTAKRTATATGVPAATVAKWLGRTSAPSVPAFLACCMAFGPGFLAAVCPGLAWAEMALALTQREALGQAIETTDARLARAADALRGRP